MRILLVEDNHLNQELARDLLEAAGHRVDLAEDGDAFRRLLSAGPAPDLVLMDVMLPGADGVTLLRWLREGARLPGVPVVAVTAQALAGDRERLVGAGFDAVITKPIDTRTFVGAIERHARAPLAPARG